VRDEDSHKGENGVVLVIGGSRDLVGALYLAAKSLAIMRAGADLVLVAAPEKIAWTLNKMSPDLIAVKMKGDHLTENHFFDMKKYIEKADVLLIGNGIGQEQGAKKLVNKLIKVDKPKIIDADAIKAIKIQDVSNAVLTPHAKEFEILLKNSGLKENELQKNLKDNVVLLKGKVDKIISKDRIVENKTGNAGMTVGGTGDVLAGITAGFVSQSDDLFEAALKAAKIMGEIGDKLEEEFCYGFIASDFLKEIPEFMKNGKSNPS